MLPNMQVAGLNDIQTSLQSVVKALYSLQQTIVTSFPQRATLPIYANNAAAITGGLVAGDLYRTGADPDHVCVVH